MNGHAPGGAGAPGDPDNGAAIEPSPHALPVLDATAFPVPIDAAPDRGAPGTGSAPAGSETRGTTRSTAPGTVLGTPGYKSPEQGRGEVDQLGPATDVYSLGAILFFLTTLADPAPAAPPQPLNPRRQDTRVDKRLAAICRKATDPDPLRRYASAGDVGADVSRWLEHARWRPIRKASWSGACASPAATTS